MKSNLLKSLKLTLAFCVFFSVFYIFILWVFAKVAGPNGGNADVVTLNGKIVGAANVGQNFTEDIYFWGRPSCAGDGYDASSSAGSNKGPTNPEYLTEVEARIVLYRCERIAQGALSSETLAELARCAARFAQASRTNPALKADFVSEDVPAALRTRVVIRLCEILTQLLAGSCSPEQSLSRAVRLAIGSALNDRACLTLLEMAAFHFAPLLETLHSSTAANRRRRNVRPKIG